MESLYFLREEYLKLEEAFLKVGKAENLKEFRQGIADLVLHIWSEEGGYHCDYGKVLAFIDGKEIAGDNEGEDDIYTDDIYTKERVQELILKAKEKGYEIIRAFEDMINVSGEMAKKFISDLVTFMTDIAFIDGDCTVAEANTIAAIGSMYEKRLNSNVSEKLDMSIFALSNNLYSGKSKTTEGMSLNRLSDTKILDDTMNIIEKMVQEGIGDFGILGESPALIKTEEGKEIKSKEGNETETGVGNETETGVGNETKSKAGKQIEIGAENETKTETDTQAKSESEEKEPEKTLEQLMAEMDNLVGLQTVKKDIHTMINYIKVCRLRRERGLKAPELSYHMVFSGNPGTGKTTIARMLAQIYKQIGLLKKGQLVEVDRSGLIAGYQGQTAIKTAEVIESALGGVLFIDEAYSLIQGDNDSYGKECIATILKAMEDHRDELIVIVAGYDDLMHEFINANPGLKSRFNKYINFPDYTGEEMEKIFLLQCKNNGYQLEEAAQKMIRKVFDKMFELRDENFGNGRTVRNSFEKIINCQATRLAKAKEEGLSDDEIMRLTVADVKEGLGMVV